MTTKHAHAFHPSHGPIGSTYMTQDAETYVRTPWGNIREQNKTIGLALQARDKQFAWLQKRYRLTLVKLAGAFLVGLVVGMLTVFVTFHNAVCGPYLINHF